MQKIIDLEIAKQITQLAIDDRGADHKFGQCQYWDNKNDNAGCAVGTGLFLGGYANQEALERLDVANAGSSKSIGYVAEIPVTGVALTPGARSYLDYVQAHQDAGYPWGEAKEYADERVAGLIEEVNNE